MRNEIIRFVVSLAVLIPLAASDLHAQTVPVTAKWRDTAQVIINGKVTETHVREGVFYRTSDGRELRRSVSFDGKPLYGQAARAVLFDSVHKTNYVIDYKKGEAFEPRMLSSPFDSSHLKDLPSTVPFPSGESSVEGYPCTLHPDYLVIPAGRLLIGSNCRSKEYDLVLKRDVTRPSQKSLGEAVHEVTEFYDIQIGVEPDPKLFDLNSFKIVPAPSQ